MCYISSSHRPFTKALVLTPKCKVNYLHTGILFYSDQPFRTFNEKTYISSMKLDAPQGIPVAHACSVPGNMGGFLYIRE